MRKNMPKKSTAKTHEGGNAWDHMTPIEELRRSVLACFLWEDTFYEEGESIADRIANNAAKVAIEDLAALAVEARGPFNLRHAPLLLLDALSKLGRGNRLVADTIASVIQRPDEMGELLAIYWRNGRKMVPAQMRKGLARAFAKFDEYQLAKYDRDGAVKLRDVLRLARPKPEDADQSALYKRVKERTLATPDTWEVSLSSGADKKETFERLLSEGKLGYLALLRNLRNMAEAGVDKELVRNAIVARKGARRVLPFRYIAASRAAPQYDKYLDEALLASLAEMPPLPGTTVVLVDTSGSMSGRLSARSEVTRADAAASLAAVIRGDLRVFMFASTCKEIPARRGLSGVEAINSRNGEVGHGTNIAGAVEYVNGIVKYDRIIVITDEQAHDGIANPTGKYAYVINTAAYQNGVGYGQWTHIDGFSEATLRYIYECEKDKEPLTMVA